MVIGTVSKIDKEAPFFVGGSGKAYLRIALVEVLCDDRMDIINHGFELGQKVVIVNDEECARRKSWSESDTEHNSLNRKDGNE
jgi:hypothetical protein